MGINTASLIQLLTTELRDEREVYRLCILCEYHYLILHLFIFVLVKYIHTYL